MAKTKVPVTMRALTQRINRRLAQNGGVEKRFPHVLKKAKGSAVYNLGEYYILDPYRNMIVDMKVDPEYLARKLGVLADWEQLAD